MKRAFFHKNTNRHGNKHMQVSSGHLNSKISRMKSVWLPVALIVLSTVVLTSFVWNDPSENAQKPKKERHIHLVKIKDGKKMELDTVFTNDDVFVWNGDTINPMRHFPEFGGADSVVIHRLGKPGERGNALFFKHRGGKGEPMFIGKHPGENMEIITEDIDSTGRKIVVRDMRKGEKGNRMFFLHDDAAQFGPVPPVPPVPPLPPVPHMKMFKIKHDNRIIDLNDPDIISYKKKSLSGDREKIEIIRKKSNEKDDETFRMKWDGVDVVAPEASDDFMWDSDGDSLKTKIIERKKVIDGKDAKEIEIKVEKKENK